MARKWSEIKAEREEDAQFQKTRSRVRRISTTELLDWTDVAGSQMAKGFMDYRRYGHVESLEEVKLGLLQLRALTEELIERHEAVDR